MADRNIFIGYDLGCGLAPQPGRLPAELRDPGQLAKFVDEIDCTLVVDGNGNEDWVNAGEHLRNMAEKSLGVMPRRTDPVTRLGMTLRLWAGCVWAAKPLDCPELTPEFRGTIFKQDIDPRATKDPLFRAGVEAAPAFNALPNAKRKQAALPRRRPTGLRSASPRQLRGLGSRSMAVATYSRLQVLQRVGFLPRYFAARFRS
jgi:hypothetical protein